MRRLWMGSVAAGLACALVALWTWGSLDEPPALNDERAYHAQARIFATGRWTAPSPPHPEFFHQIYMFTDPVVASKYWPGHSLALTPGVWLGVPGLVPIVFTGVVGALIFAIVARLYGVPTAVLTVFLWGTSAYSLRYRVSFLSHATTGALWILACWMLLAWREDVRRRALAVCIGLALAAIAVTRPLTAVGLGFPIAFVLGRGLRAPAARQGLLLAAAAGAVVLLLIPLWSVRTLGTWTTTPYAEYARLYFPFDRLGFGFDPTPPARPLTSEMRRYYESLGDYFREHTWRALPRNALFRAREAVLQQSLFWPLPLWLLFAVAVWARIRSDALFRFGLLSAISLFAVHLVFAHPRWWTAYYSEVFPVFYLGAALGVREILAWFGLQAEQGRTGRLRWVYAVLLAVLAPVAVHSVKVARSARQSWGDQLRTAERAFESISGARAIVFVHHEPDYDLASGIVSADPFWGSSARWVVHDLGDANRLLMQAAPDRHAYLYSCPSGELRPLRSAEILTSR